MKMAPDDREPFYFGRRVANGGPAGGPAYTQILKVL